MGGWDLIYSLDFSHLIEYDAILQVISLDIEISVGGGVAKLSAKIDTGSTDCVFARKPGEQVGLNIKAGEFFRNSARQSAASQHTGIILRFRFSITVSTRAFVFAADESFNRNVLGRNDFLNQVLLGLNDYEGKIYLSSIAETWS